MLLRRSPTHIEAIKTVFLQHVHHRLGEGLSGRLAFGHTRVLDAALVPATDRQDGLQLFVLLLERIETTERVLAIVVREVIPRIERHNLAIIIQTGERVDDVRADERIDVLHVELTVTGPVDRPSSVVTDQWLFGDLCKN